MVGFGDRVQEQAGLSSVPCAILKPLCKWAFYTKEAEIRKSVESLPLPRP